MAKIAVFDSGLGSLSVIRAIRQNCKAQIIYFADQRNYPYGTKSQARLGAIIEETIKILRDRFVPDVIVMASNTPSLMLDVPRKVIGVRPPLREAQRRSRTKKIGILATRSAIKSRGLARYIEKERLSRTKIFRINGTSLVDLVETGKFLSNEKLCRKVIRKSLYSIVARNSIDVVTLSSTHLPFLKPLLEQEFPDILFLDPGEVVARKVCDRIRDAQGKSSLKIFTTGDPKRMQESLAKLGIKNRVNGFS